ncbi:helix-turn-helix domain-containing protein [Paenibacillus nasutitermitis]|uniref:AraC family transcriptional regulator n=1 Tax=Paenibacillus nasutitermitis TaxID=1652958 RepID=A0A916Z7M8_9BACL|nr:AraC family transcriptional regulator [Paenibacillus nasutitermitis]GGD80232.1 AraC family transcriptional regulator [Paenibacillus nasutitermitis]
MNNSNYISIPINVIKSVSAGSIVYPPRGRFGPRIQSDIQIVMLYSGEMNVNIDGRSVHAAPGQVMMLMPGHEEMFTFSRTEDSWHRWIAIHAPMLESEVLEQLSSLPICLPISEEMNRLLDLILRIQQHTQAADPLLISLGLAALQLYPTESKLEMQKQEKHPAVYAALAWIANHYMDECTLKQMASHAGVSSEHLVRLFKQHEHTTPIQYVWRYRVDKAIGLLTNTGLSVSEISQRCGFKTSHHFARLVKKTTGCTASEIREQSWGGFLNL